MIIIMFKYIKECNIKSIFICIIPLLYNIYNYDCHYINLLMNKINILNYTQYTNIFNINGTYFITNNISLELNIKWSIKYN